MAPRERLEDRQEAERVGALEAEGRVCLEVQVDGPRLGVGIKEGSFPVPVIRVGRLIRIPTAALLRLVTGHGEAAAEPSDDEKEYPPNTAPRDRKRLTA